MARKKNYNGDITEEFDTNELLDAYHQQEKMDKLASTAKSAIIEIAISILIVFLFVTFLFRPVSVSGTSMYPTLTDKEFGFSSVIGKTLCGIQRDDIVIIKTDGKYIIKRVIGLPGETIACVDGVLYINEEPIDESSYLDSDYIESMKEQGVQYFTSDFGPVTLNSDEYFCLGDNRPNSADSRVYGAFTIEQIVAKDFYKIFG
jgi:signal peptidase I